MLTFLVLISLVTGQLAENADVPQGALFSTSEIRDSSTLEVEVLQDWHVDTVAGTTRQKLVEITVAEWWPGCDFRVPVRLITPLTGKATGFHITSDYTCEALMADAALDDLDSQLIAGGVGVVLTVVQPLPLMPDGQALEQGMFARLLQSHDPRYTPYWIWATTLMRAATAAYAETDHFEPGKIASSGRSKNGAAPVTALINDDRFTAVCATIAPIYASPFRLCEQDAVEEVEAANKRFSDAVEQGIIRPTEHPAEWYVACAGYGAQKELHQLTLTAGWTQDNIVRLTERLLDNICVAGHWESLKARDVDVLFQPATHDWVAFDILWGAQHYPQIPVYYKANYGHDRTPHPAAEKDDRNCEALFLKHFFGEQEQLLQPADSEYEIVNGRLWVRVAFPHGPQPESGRIWWLYDREPGGSAGYLWKRIPDDHWQDMTLDKATGTWTAEIPLEPGASSIEFFSNHGLEVKGCQTYLSSPYTRVQLDAPHS